MSWRQRAFEAVVRASVKQEMLQLCKVCWRGSWSLEVGASPPKYSLQALISAHSPSLCSRCLIVYAMIRAMVLPR